MLLAPRLDAQLQEAIKQIESKSGIVATISTAEAAKKSFSSKSAYLTQTLSSGKLIIVVTIQTFPFVLEAIQENKALAGRKFAVIADEAHSSQTGQTASKLKQVLSDQEAQDLADGGEVDVEMILAAEAKASQAQLIGIVGAVLGLAGLGTAVAALRRRAA